MKKYLFLLLTLPLFALNACKTEDPTSVYPKTVNIKYEITTTKNKVGYVERTFNNETVEDFPKFPYSFTYARQEVELGTYLKLTFDGDNTVVVEPNPNPGATYDVELKISVDDEIVATKSKTVSISDDLIILDYTFQ